MPNLDVKVGGVSKASSVDGGANGRSADAIGKRTLVEQTAPAAPSAATTAPAEPREPTPTAPVGLPRLQLKGVPPATNTAKSQTDRSSTSGPGATPGAVSDPGTSTPATADPAHDPGHADGGTASNLGDFRGDARQGPDLTAAAVTRMVDVNQRLIAPAGSRYNRSTNSFLLPGGQTIAVTVGSSADGSVASFQQTNAGYVVTVSSRARDQDVVRAVAHEVAEIVATQDPHVTADPTSSDRPRVLTAHLVGRFAELRVLLAQIDRARHLSGEQHRLLQLERDLDQLVDGIGLVQTDGAEVRWRLLLEHDPALYQRLYLTWVGADQRPLFDPALDRRQFTEQRNARLRGLAKHLDGDRVGAVVGVDAMAMSGEMRLEEARRIFDPVFKDQTARRALDTADRPGKQALFRALDPINAAINHPSLPPKARGVRIFAAITALQNSTAVPPAVVQAIDFEAMRTAAIALVAASTISPGNVLDHSSGLVRLGEGLPGKKPGTEIPLRELFDLVDHANRGVAENGMSVEYVVVVHDPVEGMSMVEVVSRPRPQYRLPAVGQNRRPPTETRGGSIVDIGVGRSGYGAEMTPQADLEHGGLVIQTELPDTLGAAQRRRDLGVADPAPSTGPGAIMVFGDLMSYGSLLAGPNGGIARMFINNLSGFHAPNAPESEYLPMYRHIAEQLCSAALPQARIEVQWDMKSERKEGGTPGDRKHLRGDVLAKVIQNMQVRKVGVSDEDFGPQGNSDYDYSIDAGASNTPDADKMAQYENPRPQRRVVITFLDHPPMKASL